MKRILILLMAVLSAINILAQDVTTFLGIPVDGNKSDFRQKLIDKGFETIEQDRDILLGEFNGRKSLLSIGTTSNKVSRILVKDLNGSTETDIKIRFNHLVRQFENSSKYVNNPGIEEESQVIPDDEDISYEMLVHNKRYEASYCQLVQTVDLEDSVAVEAAIHEYMLTKYTEEQIQNPTDEEKYDMVLMAGSWKINEQLRNSIFRLPKRSVWFMISEESGKYYILMFYDNEFNREVAEEDI